MPDVEHVSVRPERADDHETIHHVVAAAFESELEARLVAAIRASDNYIADLALVATLDEDDDTGTAAAAIVGHVMISYVGLDTGQDRGVVQVPSLSPLAVRPDHHRRGIGSLLVRTVTRLADERGEPLVVLEGDPAYYGRLGFEHSVRHGIEIDLPSWAPAEAAQVMVLRNHDPSLRGRIVYPPAFHTVDDRR